MKSITKTLMAISLGALAMGSIFVSASDHQQHVVIKLDKTNDQHAIVDLSVNGESQVFELPELAVGESKSITTNDGKTIVLSRSEQGLTVDYDGKKIELPRLNNNLSTRIQRSMPLHHSNDNSIRITGAELTETQKQIIKDAFVSAGIDKNVTFSKEKSFFFVTSDMDNSANKKVIMRSGDHDQLISELQEHIEVVIDSDGNIDGEDVEVHTQIIRIEEKDEN